jgi:2'-5' RNA ligase
MRLFIALTPTIEAVEHLEERIEVVRRRVPPPSARAMRWVPSRRWHVTLAFIGEADAAVVDGLVDDLAQSMAEAPVPTVRMAGGGALGGHVIHVGVEELRGDEVVADPLGPLEQLARAAVRRQRLHVDRRTFHPHLTVARFRARIAVDPVTDALFDYVGPWWRASELELIESVLGPEPVYRTLASVPLVAGSGGDAPAG